MRLTLLLICLAVLPAAGAVFASDGAQAVPEEQGSAEVGALCLPPRLFERKADLAFRQTGNQGERRNARVISGAGAG